MSSIFESQGRLRENIKALENMPQSSLVDRYMKDLDREEDELIQTRQQIEALSSRRSGILSDIKAKRSTLRAMADEYREHGRIVSPAFDGI